MLFWLWLSVGLNQFGVIFHFVQFIKHFLVDFVLLILLEVQQVVAETAFLGELLLDIRFHH